MDEIIKLLTDITTARSNKDSWYFLSSIVLTLKEPSRYDVVDGQQRLTSLTIILSVIRFLLCKYGDAKEAKNITNALHSEINIGKGVTGAKSGYHLILSRHEKFFKENVQDEGGMKKLIEKL